MSAHPDPTTLDAVDDLRPAATHADLASGRRSFLRRGAIAGGGLVALGTIFDSLASPASAALSGGGRSEAQDIDILNYALTLEFLEADFYAQAVSKNAYGKNRELEAFAKAVKKHEAEHVDALINALGPKAVKKPKFNFGKAVTDPATFLATAVILEDTGVSAYAGQVTNIYSEPYLQFAASILTVEARHAAWGRFLLGGGALGAPESKQPAPKTFDAPETKANVLKAVTATGFIVG